MKCSVVITPNLSRAVSRRAGCWHGQTRQNHRVRMLARLGWRWYSAGERELLAGYRWRALEHDPPGVLLQLACGWLRAERIVGAPADALARRVATARDAPALRPITAWTLCCNHRGRRAV